LTNALGLKYKMREEEKTGSRSASAFQGQSRQDSAGLELALRSLTEAGKYGKTIEDVSLEITTLLLRSLTVY
jgi:hypothetical protein